MAPPASESSDRVLRLDFDRHLMMQFGGSVVTSDAELLPYRELDDLLAFSTTESNVLADGRTGRNGRHALACLLRQSVFGRLAGYNQAIQKIATIRANPGAIWGIPVKSG
jgi:hypothetical protein